jgi:hypothetical protein
MFRNCTALTHIRSNWDNSYTNGITATDCYSGCTAITHIDDENVIAYEGDAGLDYVPTEWGGGGFTADGTTIYVLDTSLGTSLEMNMCGRTDIQNEVMLINWGDGTPTAVGYTHTYAKNGIYTVKVKGFIHSLNLASYGTSSNVITSGTRICITNILKVSKTTHYHNTGYVSIKSFGGAFANLPNLQTVDVSNWAEIDIGSFEPYGRNIAGMFLECSSLTNIIGFNKLNLSNVTDCPTVFKGCTSLTYINMNGMNLGKAKNFDSMLQDCTSLTHIDMSNVDMSACNSIMTFASGCNSLKEVIGLNTIKFGDKIRMATDHAFKDCFNLEKIDFKGNNFIIYRCMRMFDGCKKLGYIDFGDIEFTNLADGAFGLVASETNTIEKMQFECPNYEANSLFRVFSGKCNITEINFEGSNFSSVTNIEQCFYQNNIVKTISFKNTNLNNVTSWNFCFGAASSLENLNLDGCTLIANPLLGNSAKLTVTSLLSVINALKDNRGSETLTCTIGATNLAKLTSTQIKIATDKNWTLA